MAIIAAIVWLIRLEGRVNQHGEDGTKVWTTMAEIQKTTGALEALVMLHKEQFHEYQLQAAKDFVSNTAISEIKRDIITELGRVEARVETQIDRLVAREK